MTLKKVLLLVAFLGSVAFGLHAGAGPSNDPAEVYAAARRLIDRELQRPHPQEVLEAVPPQLMTDNEFWKNHGIEIPDYRVHQWIVAEIITQLEYLNPGAILVPMGRDVVMIGDSVDTFYRQFGIEGRVLRLNGSGETIRGTGGESLVKFMRGAGIDFDAAARGEKKYILMDETNNGVGSQSRSLMIAAHNELKRLGATDDIRFKAVNLYNTYFPGSNKIAASPDRDAVIAELRKSFDENGFPVLALTTAKLFEQGLAHYLEEWHGSFGKLQPAPSGDMVARAPGPHPAGSRTKAFGQMLGWMNVVRSPEFRNEVDKAANAIGYEFKVPLSCNGAINH